MSIVTLENISIMFEMENIFVSAKINHVISMTFAVLF